MTWYWWTHWFWITVFSILTVTDQIYFVGTYPINPPYGNKEYSKDKPLKFPLAAQTDIDDVFINGDELLSTVFRDNKLLRAKDTERSNNNAKLSDNTIIDRVANISEIKSIPDFGNKSQSENEDKLNRTKGVDVSLVNNSSFISTQSPINITTTETEAIPITETTISTIPSISISSNHTETINDNTENNSSESLEDTSQLLTSTYNKTIPSTSSSSSSIVEIVDRSVVKSFNLKNMTKEEEVIRAEIEERQLDGERGRQSKVLAEYRQELKSINLSSEAKNLLARSAAISLEDLDDHEESNISSEALSIQRPYLLDAGIISGICFAVLGLFCGVGLAGIILYRRRYLNKPQTLSEPDSSGYIDDSTIRDNSDEMYSLDNDSFLNSLEAMTIQNYWTDTVKHTKL